MLNSMEKFSTEDEINCGACGYILAETRPLQLFRAKPKEKCAFLI
jgi:hypothetical protein